MLGSLIIYLKGMGRMMFQLSGFYYKEPPFGSLQVVVQAWAPLGGSTGGHLGGEA